MYLGGNGFYATTSYDPENPHVVEVRRASGGTRPHQTPFAEQRHATSGEPAGLWRDKGKAPERLVGVGMSAQGFDRSTHYERLQDSFDPRAEFIFDGIGDTELIGDFGIIGGGAAGRNRLLQPHPRNPAQHIGPGNLGTPHRRLSTGDGRTLRDAPGIGGSNTVSPLGPRVRLRSRWGRILLGGLHRLDRLLSHNEYDNNGRPAPTNVLRRFRDAEPLK
jgi:N,N-dimethylformamidase